MIAASENFFGTAQWDDPRRKPAALGEKTRKTGPLTMFPEIDPQQKRLSRDDRVDEKIERNEDGRIAHGTGRLPQSWNFASPGTVFISQAQPVLLSLFLGYYAGAWIGKALRFPESPTFRSSGRPPPSCSPRCCSCRCESGGSIYSLSFQSTSSCNCKMVCPVGG